MNKKLLSLYGLKWDPFTPDQPTEALLRTREVEHFAWRVEQLAQDGGFALITGDPGTGKSVALRVLADKLAAIPDISAGVITHPQSSVADFYRELGHIFGVPLSTSNRYGGFKALRDRWTAHVESTLFRPLLLIDEAQLMQTQVLAELRILSSANFDSRSVLTVVLCGDKRLVERFRTPELLPLGSRIRVRLNMEYATRDGLKELLKHTLEQAGNPRLMTNPLIQTLAEHSLGNYRALMTMAGDLLAEGIKREVKQLDEKLYFDVYAAPKKEKKKGKRAS